MEQISESSRRDSADATSSSSADGRIGGEGNGEAMARGLSAMLESVIKEFDSKSIDTLSSQDKLSGSLDRLVQGKTNRSLFLNRWQTKSNHSSSPV